MSTDYSSMSLEEIRVLVTGTNHGNKFFAYFISNKHHPLVSPIRDCAPKYSFSSHPFYRWTSREVDLESLVDKLNELQIPRL